MKKRKSIVTTLRQALSYEPAELGFGTSGLRGLVKDMTSLEAYLTTRGFLDWQLEIRDIASGSAVFIAGDLRPSTTEILQAVCRAIEDAGLTVGSLGRIPTPALALHAITRKAAGVMVTGSHIPFDRNGIKFYTPDGETLKSDEAPLLAHVKKVRLQEYARPFEGSIFDERGMLRPEQQRPLPVETAEAVDEYQGRYSSAFPRGALAGRRIIVWQHSAVGRDLLVKTLHNLGAETVPAGRSDAFVPVDTEAVNDEMLQLIQALVDTNGGATIDAVVSTDGDGDRPLVLAVELGRVRFFPGDLLGLVTADFLGARHVAVPISANDAVELHCRARGITMVATRIGSPHVIEAAREAGWEGNGGFMTAAPLNVLGGGTIDPLPTRDAMLPILCALHASLGRGMSLSALMDGLPRRFGSSALLRDFPLAAGREIVRWLSPLDPSLGEVEFTSTGVAVRGLDGAERILDPGGPLREELSSITSRVTRYFTPGDGFPEPVRINWLDGVRIRFANNDVAHVRPSGNAPELRFYSNADTQDRADAITRSGVAVDGILRRMEHDATERIAITGYRAARRAIPLQGVVQHYGWGGYDFIPGLLGVQNTEHTPFAELWVGAHGRAPALADLDGTRISLDRLIAADPWLILGEDVALHFAGRLPYLFKVLDVRVMASLQAHPSKAQAEEGFARESAEGIALDAPRRNYRDNNHKPEAHVALTDFWMLHGFRPLEEISDTLRAEAELDAIMPAFPERLRAAGKDPEARSALLRGLYSRVMTMPQEETDAILNPLVGRLEAEEASGALSRASHGFWALKAARSFPLTGGRRDRGVVSIYLLNLVRLKPGQGTFQPAGTLHSYLEGANVELMANSDNVLRGGLTPKHVDVPDLLAALDFRDGRTPILEGRTASETGREYETPAEEFTLEKIEIAKGIPYSGGREHSVDCLIVIEGAASMIAGGRALTLSRGGIAMVPAFLPYSVAARSPRAVLFKAGVPQRSYT